MKLTDQQERNKKWGQSIQGIISKSYSSQKYSSKKRGHVQPNYSKEELAVWAEKNITFTLLYKKYTLSGYDSKLRPSFDRLKNELPYSFDNLQVLTWQENNKKKNSSSHKGTEIVKYSLKGVKLATYSTIRVASKETTGNSLSRGIGKCVNGDLKTAYGFIWKKK